VDDHRARSISRCDFGIDGGTPVKRSLALVALLGLCSLAPSETARAQEALRLTGSGATFPFPLYSAWFKAFGQKRRGVTVDYQGTGRAPGTQDLTNPPGDCAASDAAMPEEQISKVRGGVQLMPMTAGEIVVGYNLPGNPKGLKLPRDVYTSIFL